MSDPYEGSYNNYGGYDDYVSLSFGSYNQQPQQKVSWQERRCKVDVGMLFN